MRKFKSRLSKNDNRPIPSLVKKAGRGRRQLLPAGLYNGIYQKFCRTC